MKNNKTLSVKLTKTNTKVLTVSVCVSSLGWNNCGDEVVEELARVMPLCQGLIRIE